MNVQVLEKAVSEWHPRNEWEAEAKKIISEFVSKGFDKFGPVQIERMDGKTIRGRCSYDIKNAFFYVFEPNFGDDGKPIDFTTHIFPRTAVLQITEIDEELLFVPARQAPPLQPQAPSPTAETVRRGPPPPPDAPIVNEPVDKAGIRMFTNENLHRQNEGFGGFGFDSADG